MKKHYMKPTARAIPFRVNENIATSGVYTPSQTQGDEIRYTYDANGSKFIAFSSITASSTGDEAFDRFMDKNLMFIHNLSSNCGTSDVMPI